MAYIFIIEFSALGEFYLKKIKSTEEKQLLLNKEEVIINPLYNDDFVNKCGELSYSKEEGWHYHFAATREYLMYPGWITQKRRENGIKIIVIAKNIEKAKLFFLTFLACGHIPRPLDVPYCIDKNIAGNLKQKRITEKTLFSFNFDNWPIIINKIKIYKLCPYCEIYKNALICKKRTIKVYPTMDGTKKEDDMFCAIGCTKAYNWRHTYGMLYECNPLKIKEREIQKYPFPIIDYTKRFIKK